MSITFLKENFYNAADFVVREVANASQNIVQLSQSAYAAATPHIGSILEKIQSINVIELLKCNASISCGLLGVCIGCAAISRQIDHILGKGIFVIASTVAALFAGIFLLNPSILGLV